MSDTSLLKIEEYAKSLKVHKEKIKELEEKNKELKKKKQQLDSYIDNIEQKNQDLEREVDNAPSQYDIKKLEDKLENSEELIDEIINAYRYGAKISANELYYKYCKNYN